MGKKKAYVCSPLSAPTPDGIRRNMEAARWYMQVVSEQLDCRAVAPHAYLPDFLDDHNEQERELGLAFGHAYLDTCDLLVICGSRITEGMLGEILHAARRGIPILWIKEDYSPRGGSFGGNDYKRIRRWW